MTFPDPGNTSPSPAEQADMLIRQGNEQEDRGFPEAALGYYRQAVAAAPASPRCYLNLGNAQLSLDQAEAAISSYRTAIGLQPDYAPAYFNLGRTWYRRGEYPAAIEALQKVLDLQPDFIDAHVIIGCCFEESGAAQDAERHYRAALAIRPDYGGARVNLGSLLYSNGQIDQALPEFERAREDAPELAEAYGWLAKVHREMGLTEEALRENRQALELAPGDLTQHSSLLFALNCADGVAPEELLAAHLAFAQQHCAGIPARTRHSNSPDPERRLRVGYVSGDLIGHPVANFLESLLRGHDREQVEVFCYHNNPKSDGVTARLKEKCDQWRDIARIDDEAAGNLIERDRIDILVDLSGHTQGNRLLVFARKPAPVQATWLGYLCTTGLAAIDYRICDAYTDPPGLTEGQHVEQLARLPNCQWCYTPIIPLPPVCGLPMSANGFPTLASFNNLGKLTDPVIRLWARLLHAMPAARLIIGAVSTPASSAHLAAKFESLGIAPERLEFRSRQTPAEYFAGYGDVDMALDPFPYNGGTTSFDALLMGVPFVTLKGERPISRGGVSILANLGLGELIADTPEDYIRIVCDLVNDPARLAGLRATLRQRMEESPLMDAPRFARDMEQLYRRMWHQWAAQAQHATDTTAAERKTTNVLARFLSRFR